MKDILIKLLEQSDCIETKGEIYFEDLIVLYARIKAFTSLYTAKHEIKDELERFCKAYLYYKRKAFIDIFGIYNKDVELAISNERYCIKTNDCSFLLDLQTAVQKLNSGETIDDENLEKLYFQLIEIGRGIYRNAEYVFYKQKNNI